MDLQKIIEKSWDNRDYLKEKIAVEAIQKTILDLDSGKFRVAEQTPDGWVVNIWIKKR